MHISINKISFQAPSLVALLFLGIFSLLTSTNSTAQGIEFFSGTFEEAKAKAKEEGKPIFVDAYAVWCGPCKRMAKQVFTTPEAGAFYNTNFVNMKLDMEKGEGLKFRQKYPVSAFPTLFYIGSDGTVLHKLKGAQQLADFIKIGEMVLGKVDHSKDYAEEYEKGKRDPEFIYEYIAALNKSKKSSIKIANKYLTKKTDYKNPINLKIVYEATQESDSRLFDLLIQHKKAITNLYSKELVNAKIKQACATTAAKAIEYESEDLLNESKTLMKKHLPKEATLFALQSDMEFCLAMGDAQKYLKCCNDYVKKEVKDNDKKLHSLAQQIEKNFSKNSPAMKQAEKLAKKALDQNEEILDYHLTYASILNKNGKKSQALKVANESMELATKIGGEKHVRKLIQVIGG